MKRNKCGFTLIELLLVISIIFVILMLIVPSLAAVRRKALMVGCVSNLRQIHSMILIYQGDYGNYIPYLFYASEGMLDPEHMQDPQTKISGLAKIAKDLGINPEILKCPADTGYDGADYGLTPDGVTCYACLGQSYAYNNSVYTDPSSPYDRSKPVDYQQAEQADNPIIMLSDFSSVWHGAAGSGDKSAKYYLNMLYFGGHVDGKEFFSDQEAKAYRNQHSRWWVDEEE